jgi:hypothetical protein
VRKQTLLFPGLLGGVLAVLASANLSAYAQNGVQFQTPTMTPLPAGPAFQPPGVGMQGGAALQPPSFDPYSVRPDALSSPQVFIPPNGQQYAPQPNFPAQPFGQPAQPYAYPGQPLPGQFPNQQPNAYFPGGVPIAADGPYLRVFQDLRFRYTWLGENGFSDMEINKLELATTMNIPNFVWSGQPLQISPGFAIDFWSGPTNPVSPMPGSAYSAYLDFAWKPVLNERISGDISVRPGIYSDFNALSLENALRVTGVGLMIVQLTPTLAVKGGIEYLDRREVKMLPAGGLVWRPSPKSYFDIYFPRPKVASYLFTLGDTTHVWWYLGAEYGGGTWEIEDLVGSNIQVDVNDYRVFGGFEWTGGRGLNGFIEAGYVFERELNFGGGVNQNTGLDSTWMLRAGLSY